MVLACWASSPRGPRPRRAISRYPVQDNTVYTDAPAETVILEIDAFGEREVDDAGGASGAYREVESAEWVALFPQSTFFGLELLASPQTVAGPRIDPDRKRITSYSGRNNSKMALIRSGSRRRIIATAVQIFRIS